MTSFLPALTFFQLVCSATAVAILTVFLAIMDMAAESWANPLDIQVGKAVIQHRCKADTRVMRGFSRLGGPQGITISSGLWAGLLFMKVGPSTAGLFLGVVAASILYVLLMKLMTARKRPKRKPLEVERTFSFPSAHSLASTTVYVSAGATCYQLGYGSWPMVVAIALVGAIGVSRIYLGCHYFSDVLAGFFGGIVWAGIFMWLSFIH